MARVNHKKVRQLLDEKRSKITDRQFFTSRILAGHFEDIAAAQTRRYKYNRRVHVYLYWDHNDPNVACTDNTVIKINCGNKVVTKIRGRLNRYKIISGLFAHELGHVLYTDFLAKQTYLRYLEHEKWFPGPPNLKTTQDARNELDFWSYSKAEPRNLQMIQYIKQKIDAKPSMMKELYIQKLRGTITESEYVEQMQRLNSDHNEAEARITEITTNILEINRTLNLTSDKKAIIAQYTGSTSLTKEMVDTLIDFIEVGKKDPVSKMTPVIIHWNF